METDLAEYRAAAELYSQFMGLAECNRGPYIPREIGIQLERPSLDGWEDFIMPVMRNLKREGIPCYLSIRPKAAIELIMIMPPRFNGEQW